MAIEQMVEHAVEEQAAAPAENVEEWTYAGREHDGKGKTQQGWIDASGEYLYFKSLVPSPVIGGVYRVTCERKPNGKVSVKLGAGKTPVYDRRMDWEPERLARMVATDKAAGVVVRQIAIAGKEKRESGLTALLTGLHEGYLNSAPADRAAYLATIISAVTGGPKRGR